MEGNVSNTEGMLSKVDKKISNLHQELWQHEKSNSARTSMCSYVHAVLPSSILSTPRFLCVHSVAQLLPKRTQVSNQDVHSQFSTE